MSQKGILSGLFIILVLAGAVALFASQNPGTPAPATTANLTEQVTTEGAKEFKITAQNFSFSPASIAVNKGDKVRIIFDNVDGFHDFRIDEFGVAAKKIGSGAEDTVEFTADKTGAFQYYCSVGNHRQMGMVGTLIVQ